MPDVLTNTEQEGIFCQQDIVQKSVVCFCLALTGNVFNNKVRSGGGRTTLLKENVYTYIYTVT